VKGINIGEVRKLQIPLPPRSKQDELAMRLAMVEQSLALSGRETLRGLQTQLLKAVFD
jgi:hypothetical protein